MADLSVHDPSFKESYLLNLIPMLCYLQRKGKELSARERYDAVRKAADLSLVCVTGRQESWCKALLKHVVWRSSRQAGGLDRRRSHYKPCIALLKRLRRRRHFLCSWNRHRRVNGWLTKMEGTNKRKRNSISLVTSSRYLAVRACGSLKDSAHNQHVNEQSPFNYTSVVHGDGFSQEQLQLIARFRAMVPGGHYAQDLSKFLHEAAHYITALEVQVDALTVLVAASQLPTSIS